MGYHGNTICPAERSGRSDECMEKHGRWKVQKHNAFTDDAEGIKVEKQLISKK